MQIRPGAGNVAQRSNFEFMGIAEPLAKFKLVTRARTPESVCPRVNATLTVSASLVSPSLSVTMSKKVNTVGSVQLAIGDAVKDGVDVSTPVNKTSQPVESVCVQL